MPQGPRARGVRPARFPNVFAAAAYGQRSAGADSFVVTGPGNEASLGGERESMRLRFPHAFVASAMLFGLGSPQEAAAAYRHERNRTGDQQPTGQRTRGRRLPLRPTRATQQSGDAVGEHENEPARSGLLSRITSILDRVGLLDAILD